LQFTSLACRFGCVLCVLQQVVQNLAQLLCVTHHALTAWVEFHAHRHLRGFAGIKLQHLGHQQIQVDGSQFGCRQSCVVPKLVHEPLHGIHLIHDGLHGFGKQQLLRRRNLVREFHQQAFCRQLNRRERVLDLVCQTACHFAPGLDPLRGNDLRNIVKDQQPGSPWQLRTPRHQYQRILRLAANQSGTGIAQFKRLLPMVESMFGTHTEERIKLDLHIFAKFLQAIDVRQTLPLQRRQRDAKNALGAQIG